MLSLTTLKTIRWGLTAISAASALYYLPVRPVVFVGDSMKPTYQSMEVAWTTRYQGDLRRGDVVVFQRDGRSIVKRVSHLPGDEYLMAYVAGSWVSGDAANPARITNKTRRLLKTFIVPEGHVRVLGDNPIASVDSRHFGPIPMDSITRIVDDARPQSLNSVYP